MNKKQLITRISTKTGIKKSVVNLVLSSLKDNLIIAMQKGDVVNIFGFGKFETKQRGERKYISFQTGETFMSAPHLVPVLKFSKQFIDKF